MRETQPPSWLEAVLRRALPEEDRDAIAADVAELYAERARRDGRAAALWWYVRHVARFAATVPLSSATRSRTGTGEPSGRGGGAMTGMGEELFWAVRRLVRAPVFAVVSVTTIAAGIGAFASIYSVVDTVLIEEPPYEEPDELIWVWRDYWFELDRGWLGGPDIVKLREHHEAFEDVVAFRSVERNLTGAEGDNPRRVRLTVASAGFFDLLGVRPALGRGFQPGEDTPDAAPVAVLSHELWRTHFAADQGVLGRDIYLNGEATTVVGVAPEDFHFVKHSSLGPPAPPADIFVPMRMDLASLDPGGGMFAGLARVRDGASAAEVEAAIDAVAADLDEIFDNRGLEMWGIGLHDDLVGDVRPALVALPIAAGILLLILVANLASLLLGRASQRDRELALISALGAGRARLLQSSLAESLVLSVVGGGLGIALAVLGVDALRGLAPEDLPRRLDLAVDPSVLLVALVATLAMGLCAGALPALRGLREASAQRLRDGARAGGGLVGSKTRAGLVVAQVALSLVLLVGSALLTRAFVRLLLADPGLDGREAMTLTVALDPNRYPTDADVVEFDRRFRLAVSGLPGVRAVGAVDGLPLSAFASQTTMTFPGAPGNTGVAEEDRPLVDYMMATPGYMEAAGMRLLEGRTFDERDETDSPPVAIIDDLLAKRFFGSGSALGQRIVAGDTAMIVGVVDHVRHYQVHADGRPQIYIPMSQNAVASLRYVISGAGEPTVYAPEVRGLLDAIDPAVPITDIGTLKELIERSIGKERLSLTLLTIFALAALLLAVLGVYGVVSNAVSRRTHEMGVRMALGADRDRVVRLVLGQGLRLTLWGTVIGLGGALLGARALRGVMVGVDPADPWAYAGVALVLALVTGVAAWVPARRATRIDPVVALRME